MGNVRMGEREMELRCGGMRVDNEGGMVKKMNGGGVVWN